MTSVLDGLYREIHKARERAYELVRVRVTPFVDPGAVAPRGREVWLHPADYQMAQLDTNWPTEAFGGRDVLLGIPVVHGFPAAH